MSVVPTDMLVPVANGGTGAATANAALNALLPSQTGNSGEFLTTDGTNASWAAPSLGSSFVGKTIAVYKTGNQSVTSSTTLVDCTDLSFSIGANEVWMGYIMPIMAAGTSGGVKWAFTLPASCAGRIRTTGGNSFANASVDIDVTAGLGVTGTHQTSTFYIGYFNITNGANAGTVQFKFAQNASNGTNTTVSKNSQLVAWRVS